MRPGLLLYCQHSVGIGHLMRSLLLASKLAGRFRVVLLNGGPVPPGLDIPKDIEIVDLPPLGMPDGHELVSRDANFDLVKQKIVAVHMRDLCLEDYPFRRLLTRLNEIGFAGFCLAEIPESADPVRVMRYYRALFLAYQGLL